MPISGEATLRQRALKFAKRIKACREKRRTVRSCLQERCENMAQRQGCARDLFLETETFTGLSETDRDRDLYARDEIET